MPEVRRVAPADGLKKAKRHLKGRATPWPHAQFIRPQRVARHPSRTCLHGGHAVCVWLAARTDYQRTSPRASMR